MEFDNLKPGMMLRIEAFDHFSSDNLEEDYCIAEFIGIFVKETKHYLQICYINANIKDPESAIEVHNIVKEAIKKYDVYKQDSSIEEEDFK